MLYFIAFKLTQNRILLYLLCVVSIWRDGSE
jgi:hypothetical protein